MKTWAICWSSSGGPKEAVAVLRTATRLDPTLESAHFNLGKALALLGKGKEADAAFEQCFELNPERKKLALAAEHQKAGRVDEARALYQEILRANPANVDALRMMGIISFGEGRDRRGGTISSARHFSRA